MKIILADHSGFCMGVRSAILKIVQEIDSSKEEIYVYGPLIHNPQTIKVLNDRGLKTIDSLDNISKKQITIRTHGIPVDQYKKIKSESSRVINLTCPKVGKVQSIIKKYSQKGYYTIILGDKDHAEVISLESYAVSGVFILSKIADVEDIPDKKKYILISQTTLDRIFFNEAVQILSNKLENLKVMDTICDSTRLRQEDVISAIDDNIDTLIVVGGKNSANTKRLAKIGMEKNIKTFHVETEEEITEDDFLDSNYVLVTAGASTPGWIINNILEKLYNIKFDKSNIFLNAFKNILEFVVRTNLLSAFAGFFMSSIALKYSHFEMTLKFPIISFLYLYSMYSINNYFDKEFLKISNSYKHRVYKKYGLFLLGISILFILISIYISSYISKNVTIVLLLSYLLGISYSTNIIKNIIKKINFNSISKIYNSKILAILGWIIIINILPLVYYGKGILISIPFMIFVLTIIFQRHFLTDLIAYQGDFIFGRKTIPIIFGDKRNLILYILSISSIITYGLSTIFFKNYIDLFLIVNILYYIYLLYIINKHRYLISLKYEILVDLNFTIIIFYSIFRYYF